MQNFLLIGAFILLGMLILAINNTLIFTNTATVENEVQITVAGIAQALMEEIISKAFDENTVGDKKIAGTDQLTVSANLGEDSGEPPFDDVDDYNGIIRIKDTPRISGYIIKVKVGYANPTNPIEFVSARSFLKRIEIAVKDSKFMHNPDSLILASVVSYFCCEALQIYNLAMKL